MTEPNVPGRQRRPVRDRPWLTRTYAGQSTTSQSGRAQV